MTDGKSFSHSDYTLAWICALPLELAAASVMLDETHPRLPSNLPSQCTYTLGKIEGHNVVLACLPSGIYGTTSATAVVSHLTSIFPNLRCGLLVGIGGGAPSRTVDIRLGDVVVATPSGSSSGVVQYDFGKAISGGRFQLTGVMNQPPTLLLTAVSQLKANEMIGGCNPVSQIISDTLSHNPGMEPRFSRPSSEEDKLYDSTYDHPGSSTSCDSCDINRCVSRTQRESDEPEVHYGLVASGNQVMKDGRTRDRIAQEFNALCFEMEAAGIMNHLPSLVIRGICDYCDSHKNKQWQGYAALAAAAYAKLLLSAVTRVNEGVADLRPSEACWMVPFDRNLRFLGRESIINRLENEMLTGGSTRKVAVAGLGGVGKTQIALEIAYRTRERDPECSIFWISSTSMEAVEQAFVVMSTKIGLQNVRPSEAKSRVKEHLSRESAGPWILIVDNADDMDMWTKRGNSHPALKTFLPRSKIGSILVTTRNRQLAYSLVGPSIVNVTELDEALSRDLLRVSLIQEKSEDLAQDSESAVVLVRQLGGLPLALIQAASYINRNMITLKDYLSLLDDQESTVIELLSQDFEDDYRYENIQNPVAATWMISFERIRQSSPLATNYLSMMACVSHRDIPLLLLPPGISRIEQHNALGVLESYSFITQSSNTRAINMHRLVHLATRNWLRSENTLVEWSMRTGESLREIFPSDYLQYGLLWREYLPHLLFILQTQDFPRETQMREELVVMTGKCLETDGRYNEAVVFLEEAFEAKTLRLENDDPEVLSHMGWLGGMYRKQGRLKEAEEKLIRVIEKGETVLGSDHLVTLAAMENLAFILGYQRNFEKAEELRAQVVGKLKQILGPEHPRTLASMTCLAAAYRHREKWKEAEEIELQLMEKMKTVLGPEHPVTLNNMAGLASTYSRQERWSEAEELFIEVIEKRKKVSSPEHPYTLSIMSKLGSMYMDQRIWGKAEGLFMEVIEKRKKVLGPEHPDTLSSMTSLVFIYSQKNQLQDAEELCVEVTEKCKTALGPEHPGTLLSMWDLASIRKSQGRQKEAVTLLEVCAELQEKVLGPNHPDTTRSRSHLESWR